jgi:hypothetical protein
VDTWPDGEHRPESVPPTRRSAREGDGRPRQRSHPGKRIRQCRFRTSQIVIFGVAAALATPVVAQGAGLLDRTEPGTDGDQVRPASTGGTEQTAGELVVNGGFEDSVSGWRVTTAREGKLVHLPDGHSGAGSAAVEAVTAGTLVLNDAVNTVASTRRDVTYTVTAFLRSDRQGLTGMARVREVKSGQLVHSSGDVVRLTTSWQKITFTHTTREAGAHLDLNLLAWNAPRGAKLVVDDVSMRRADPATPSPTTSSTEPTTSSTEPTTSSTEPTTSTTEPTTSTTEPTTSSTVGGDACANERGIPSCGTFLGAAIGSNADPTSKESTFGHRLALRRTYYRADQVPNALRTVKTDLAAGRLPWISFKLPRSWSEMADGAGDAWAKDLATRLSEVDGPVWIAFHHEPENDGAMSEWVRMQARLSPIIRSRAPNVAYTIVLTGWNQVFGSNTGYSFEATWPGDGLVDIIGIDPYNEYGTVKNGKTITKSRELKEYYAPLAAFAKKHRARWAVAETGYTDLQASRDPAWLNRAYSDMRSMGGIGLAYFDSHLNSTANWQLSTKDKIDAFSTALRGSSRLAP